jgi:hypothetical protein
MRSPTPPFAGPSLLIFSHYWDSSYQWDLSQEQQLKGAFCDGAVKYIFDR